MNISYVSNVLLWISSWQGANRRSGLVLYYALFLAITGGSSNSRHLASTSTYRFFFPFSPGGWMVWNGRDDSFDDIMPICNSVHFHIGRIQSCLYTSHAKTHSYTRTIPTTNNPSSRSAAQNPYAVSPASRTLCTHHPRRPIPLPRPPLTAGTCTTGSGALDPAFLLPQHAQHTPTRTPADSSGRTLE